MAKKFKHLVWIVCVSMSLFMLVGCQDSKNKTQSLKDIVNLSASDVSIIKTSEGGGMQTEIEDTKQIEEISSFLSGIDLSEKYVEKIIDKNIVGGGGAYFLIKYSNGASSHVQIYADENQLQILDDIKEDGSEAKWRSYTISDPSQIAKLKEILAMKPAE